MWKFKIFCLSIVLIATLLSGFYPFFKKHKSGKNEGFPIAEALSAGVFLCIALIHMLGTASDQFYRLSYHYPFAFLLAGVMFLFLLLLEHVGRDIASKKGDSSPAFAVLATVMLSVHAFLMGVALGLSDSLSIAIVIFLAIIAHKWAESFSLAIQINKSHLKLKSALFLFGIFSLMTPIGIVLGATAAQALNNYPLLEPIFSSLAAGTFLYLGTLHGLEKATLVKQCCNLRHFYFVVLGFAIMAVVAIWT